MRRAGAGVLLIGLLAVAACEQATIVQPEFRSTLPPPQLSVNHPQGETITLSNVDTLYGGASDTTSQQKQVPHVTIMKVTGSYTVSVTKNRYPVSDPSPAVLYARHGLGITVKSGSNVASNLAFPGTTDGALTMFVTLDRNARISRAFHAGGTNGAQSGTWPSDGTPWQCGTQYSDPCYKYVGTGGSVSIMPLEGTLVLKADSTTVSIGSTVKFTIDSSVVEGKSLGIEVDTVKWIPDAESEGGEYTEARAAYACAFSGWPLSCSKQILGSGTLEVVAHVNGFRKVQSKHIKVKEGQLILTADKNSIAKGETVEFKASWSDGHLPIQIDQWKFVPDTTPDVTGACASTFNPCKRAILQNGSMTVTVLRNNVKRTARARVNIVPCPTYDSILDHPKLRKAIDSLFKLADVNGANPKERWMEAFDSLGTTVVRIAPVNPNYDDLCNAFKYPDLQGPGRKVASFHIHPVAPLDPLHCPGKDPGVASDKFGGPSEQDWQSRRGQTVPEYIINPKQIQRMDLPPDEAQYWEERRGSDKIVRKYPTENVKQFLTNHARTTNGCSRY